MSLAEARARLDAVAQEIHRIRLARWEAGWPKGHRERDAHRPEKPNARPEPAATPPGRRG